jgi:hypothetical protein
MRQSSVEVRKVTHLRGAEAAGHYRSATAARRALAVSERVIALPLEINGLT